MIEAHQVSPESQEIRSGRLFLGYQASLEFLGFQEFHQHLAAQVSQEFPGCPEFQHQEPLQG